MRSSCSGALYGLGLLGGGLAQTTTSFFFGINIIGEQTGTVIGSSGDHTTMVLGCATGAVGCVYPLGQASLTVTAEPSSFIFSVSGSTVGFSGEQTSECTGTGSPITTGTCTLIGVESGSTASFVTELDPTVSPGYYQTIILNNNPGTTTAATTSPPTTQATSATTAPKSANAAQKTDTPWPIIAGAGAIAAIIGL